MMGTARTNSGRKRATLAAVFSVPWMATAARVKPESSDPESPMKMRAG